jgi:PKD repeat protein
LNYFAYNTTTGSGLVYNWDFGDGGNSTLQSPSHLYSSAGTYTVTLTVSNNGGCLGSASHTITASASAATCLSLFNIAFDTTSTDPYAYTVYNLSYGSNLTYSWLFGDGASSTLQNPTHVYSGGGPYQLCLVVDNGNGCVQTYCDSLMYVDSLSRSNNLSIHVVDGTPSVATGIQEQTFSTSVKVSPNPFSENTTFVIQSAKTNEKYSFELVDVLGKKVKVVNGITNKQFEISRDGLQNGIYFYKIYSAESVVGIGKLVIK